MDRIKAAEYLGACALIGVVMLSAALVAAYAQEKPIAVIYTEAYMDRLNAQVTEVGIAPGEDVPDADVGNIGLPQGEVVDNAYMTIPISDEEARELRWVLALEAQGEGLRGEMAVCEAIFNRVLSPRWPGTVHGVLSQKRQFATYRRIGSSRAWAKPGELEDDVISEVLRNGPSVLPSEKYVYFDSLGGVNGRRKIRIGGHTFGSE